MITRSILLSSVTLLLVTACRAEPPRQASPPSSSEGTSAKPAEKLGVFAPVEGDASTMRFWHEAYSGALLVLEVLPHGTLVETGDVVARIDARAIDAASRFSSQARSARPYSPSTSGVPPKVFVSTTSQPASR